ncbi:hypothetical protein Tco_0928826 [Tanacetum coccineum]
MQNHQTWYNQGYNQDRGNYQGNQNYQAPIQQTHVAPSNELLNYKKINEANMKAMQNQINNVKNELRNEMQSSIQTSMSNQTNELKNMMSSFFQMNTASSLGSGSLPSNTVANPRGDLKAITTRSGVSYDGPPIPPHFSSLPKVVERVPEVTKDTVQPSTENIQPPVVQNQVLIDEPVVAPKLKLTMPYPSRVNTQKLGEKDDKLALKFLEIFRQLHFDLSFADALLHMPKFATMFKSLPNNKEKLFDLATTPVNENCSTVILRKLLEKHGDPGKFLIPCDFPELVECLALADLVVDYVVDPRVPLILGRPFLGTIRALIDVYGEELTLRVDDEAITFKVGQTSKYFYNDVRSINRINVIDVACEEYVQEGNILFIKKLLNNDPSSPLPLKELNLEELYTVKSSIDDPPELELKDLPSHLEYAFLEGTDKLPVIIAKEFKEDEKVQILKVLKSHKRAIAWKIFDIKGIDP